MPTKPIQHSIFNLIKALGIWTTAALALAIVILAVTYIRIGSIIKTDTHELVNNSTQQSLLIESITKNVLELELALRTENWDTFEPTLNTLKADHKTWQDTHESLRTNPNNNQPAQELFSRIHYPFAQLNQALDEIEIVSKSIIRRAPYIDHSSHERIVAATNAIRTNEPNFLAGMNEITALYQLNASNNSNQAISTIQKSLLLLFATLAISSAVIIIPRINNPTKNSSHPNNNQTHKPTNWNFLASLGHEFRTPMNTIMGFADLLANEDQDKATKEEHARSIQSASTTLMSLIDDVFDMASIESRNPNISTSTTNPIYILDNIKDQFSKQATEKGLEFNTFIDGSCPTSITTNQPALTQIISKVLGNAIKFTKTGSVELHAAIETIDDKDMFIIRIIDTGIGIDPNHNARIFKPFQRVESNMTRQHTGAGLGLTLAQSLAQQLGGNITIKSALGAGTFVTIAIDPGKYSTQPESVDETIEKITLDLSILESKHILIVEDGQDSQRLLSNYLTKAGCSIHLADNGKIGIDRFMAAKDSKSPIDLILMDMQMPVMDGFEATAILREKCVTIPILGVTAHSSENDRKRCLSAGCDEHLAKPVKKSHLLESCALWITKHAAENQGDTSPNKKAA